MQTADRAYFAAALDSNTRLFAEILNRNRSGSHMSLHDRSVSCFTSHPWMRLECCWYWDMLVFWRQRGGRGRACLAAVIDALSRPDALYQAHPYALRLCMRHSRQHTACMPLLAHAVQEGVWVSAFLFRATKVVGRLWEA